MKSVPCICGHSERNHFPDTQGDWICGTCANHFGDFERDWHIPLDYAHYYQPDNLKWVASHAK